MKEISARVPTPNVASAKAWILRFLCQNQGSQPLIHGFSVGQLHTADVRRERLCNVEFHSQAQSAESYRKRESSFAGLLVLTVHVLRGLSHRKDRGVQIDPMPAGDLIAGDYISCPCLDRAECASLDARNLNKSGHWIAGHSQVMFQCGLRGVLHDSGFRAVCCCGQCRRHCRCHTDSRLATTLGSRQRCIVLAQVTNCCSSKHALSNLVWWKFAT